ncbi:hypothetical protein [Ammoniphilus oxalaticus]|nr:hypothetical protein [Ammoniphilus oxalaticus]
MGLLNEIGSPSLVFTGGEPFMQGNTQSIGCRSMMPKRIGSK